MLYVEKYIHWLSSSTLSLTIRVYPNNIWSIFIRLLSRKFAKSRDSPKIRTYL